MTVLNEELCWQAVERHDAAQNGAFYFGVLTTGVFCLPSCPSRKPLRKNVRFYARPADAERDGLRPCLRCHPLSWGKPSETTERIATICRYIQDHAFDELPLATLAAQAGLSPFHFQRTFKAATGVSPRAFVEACRLRLLKSGLRQAPSVTHAVYDAGFGSASRVYERSNAALGMTPRRYRAGADGIAIRFTAIDTPLGLTGIGTTSRGICFVQFGSSPESLRLALEAEYPGATVDDGGPNPEWVDALLQHIAGNSPRLDLPLDIRATAFQHLVWDFLRRIPYGETRSYSEVAAGIGKPRAARAVANACAANPVALAIPCHRVVREDGAAGGYRWGMERKQTILDREKTASGQAG